VSNLHTNGLTCKQLPQYDVHMYVIYRSEVHMCLIYHTNVSPANHCRSPSHHTSTLLPTTLNPPTPLAFAARLGNALLSFGPSAAAAYVSIRQHTSAFGNALLSFGVPAVALFGPACCTADPPSPPPPPATPSLSFGSFRWRSVCSLTLDASILCAS
jgi:hypothetical protein